MRTVYREQMDNLAHRLIVMCDQVQNMIRLSNQALFDADLVAAETVLSKIDELEELRIAAEADAIELLAREAPVARDLRQIVSGIYIVEDISRMGALAVHIANNARRHHPHKVLPAKLEGYFREMASVSESMVHNARQVLIDYDVEQALNIHRQDDSVDDIHRHLFTLSTGKDWEYSSAVTVDVTLLSRFYERFADHAVEVASRIVFLATGYKREEYLSRLDHQRDEEALNKRISEMERNFRF